MNKQEMIEEIKRLKKQKNAVILAHNYQIPEIQDIADIVGDSLKLSQEAANSNADIIILSGVHFMAESAKILSPEKKVLLPNIDAGCPMADMIDIEKLRLFKEKHPEAPVVCYVNTSAEVKAESDVCCTSSNALKIVKNLDADKVLFIPDRNLGAFIATQIPEKEIVCFDGFCITHNRIELEEIENVRKEYPTALILAHPECDPEVVKRADFVGSTSQIINFAKESDNEIFIIATEMGIMHKLENDNKGTNKKFYMLSPSLICSNMKKNRLEDIYYALEEENYEIKVDEDIRLRAIKSLDRMLELS
ncbi:quinolinate synthase A [Gottschalkia acidurici 9a]|uniref:Quinolinate synthase n=1 Tax=Gottschalkia acidurici (strain ATCC 7906 / DSM 604 / BCRC 14475 / CIP 104303 / KCTC 5404 / NCIMB 10678 / 9a) TaxID=1128398 RepID=K0AXC7_GOTA9|nr:quinolinate synthase NadA [Gottschalkia acidurici]AFS77101.1 quinolinate synthase A [Gottschalkia acidurici 9a]